MSSGVSYQPNTGPGSGLEKIMNSPEMERFMARQGDTAVGLARGYSSTPGAIRSQTVKAFNRWTVNVINDAPDAMRQEYGYGRRGERALHPLGLTLVYFWDKDPLFFRRKFRR